MTKDAVATMGALLPDDAGGRDAVHVAVVSAVSDVRLRPGQDVGVEVTEERDVRARVVSSTTVGIGIVDPYLSAMVEPGQRFWLYLYPRSITGLNHNWSHPSFPDARAGQIYTNPAGKLTSEQWLKEFCSKADCPSFHAVMSKAEDIADGGTGSEWNAEYMHFDGQDAHGDIPPEFWEHVAIYLGREIRGKKATHFSCSC